jgi:hypothetical protein
LRWPDHAGETTPNGRREIIAGQLDCAAACRLIRLLRGVPRFADLAEVGDEKAAIAAGFGWEWKQFTQHDEKYGDQLLGWLNPVQPNSSKTKSCWMEVAAKAASQAGC